MGLGFRKVDRNRWEFANEGFLRGQKHLLKSIQRGRVASSAQHVSCLEVGNYGGMQGEIERLRRDNNALMSEVVRLRQQKHVSCLEVGNYGGMQGEIERLRRDNNALMSEVVRLRQQKQSTQQEISFLSQRLQAMEQKHQQMMIFLSKVTQKPSFMAQLMQQEQATCLDTTRKCCFPSVGSSNVQDGGYTAPIDVPEDGQLLDYKESPSNVDEDLAALLQEMEQNQFRGGEAIAGLQEGWEVLPTQQLDGVKEAGNL